MSKSIDELRAAAGAERNTTTALQLRVEALEVENAQILSLLQGIATTVAEVALVAAAPVGSKPAKKAKKKAK